MAMSSPSDVAGKAAISSPEMARCLAARENTQDVAVNVDAKRCNDAAGLPSLLSSPTCGDAKDSSNAVVVSTPDLDFTREREASSVTFETDGIAETDEVPETLDSIEVAEHDSVVARSERIPVWWCLVGCIVAVYVVGWFLMFEQEMDQEVLFLTGLVGAHLLIGVAIFSLSHGRKHALTLGAVIMFVNLVSNYAVEEYRKLKSSQPEEIGDAVTEFNKRHAVVAAIVHVCFVLILWMALTNLRATRSASELLALRKEMLSRWLSAFAFVLLEAIDGIAAKVSSQRAANEWCQLLYSEPCGCGNCARFCWRPGCNEIELFYMQAQMGGDVNATASTFWQHGQAQSALAGKMTYLKAVLYLHQIIKLQVVYITMYHMRSIGIKTVAENSLSVFELITFGLAVTNVGTDLVYVRHVTMYFWDDMGLFLDNISAATGLLLMLALAYMARSAQHMCPAERKRRVSETNLAVM
eukprot:TRINITY_DN76227_c0_g1_i1.p1 TRINITY_DN76227_c0_g1~~TRINITY_DN76227_c0_g1_i1.p1  ORF type:complete len:468 (-),score=56.11 TRINITY_DN76227_c0_g1_i1:355-1758(-)